MSKLMYERSILIAGSCSPDAKFANIIDFSHNVARNIIRILLKKGATFVTSIGGNPKVDANDDNSPSIIFLSLSKNIKHSYVKLYKAELIKKDV